VYLIELQGINFHNQVVMSRHTTGIEMSFL